MKDGIVSEAEVSPVHPPVVPIPQDPFIPRARLARIVQRFPGGQFLRYVCVGAFNTVFGYCCFAAILFCLTLVLPQRLLYLTVVLASLLSTPINITVAFFGYKLVVFRTRGNYLIEWFRCFGVYSLGMLPGLLALSALTRILQSLIHSHAPLLHTQLDPVGQHLEGSSSAILRRLSNGKAAAGYLAGAIVQCVTMVLSFVGHRKFTFREKKAA